MADMEASLGVPTATSQRQIPIKLLDDNRRLINQHSLVPAAKSRIHIWSLARFESAREFSAA